MKFDGYEQVDKALKTYENYKPYHQYSIDWICDKIDWLWKWRKISRKEMEELTDRIIKIMEGDL